MSRLDAMQMNDKNLTSVLTISFYIHVTHTRGGGGGIRWNVFGWNNNNGVLQLPLPLLKKLKKRVKGRGGGGGETKRE